MTDSSRPGAAPSPEGRPGGPPGAVPDVDAGSPPPADEPPAPSPDEPAAPAVPAGPVTGDRRLESLDVLRGVAVLGILVMNIQAFAHVEEAYVNPTVRGAVAGLDGVIWGLSHVLADQKFMSIFSLLFGAGIALFAGRLEERGRRPAGLHYRRMAWLWVIGMVHAYVMWWGDILVGYALCGLVVYLMRRLSVRWLLILGSLSVLVPALMLLGLHLALPVLPAEFLTEMRSSWRPDPETVAGQLATLRGGLLDQLPARAATVVEGQIFGFVFFVGWRSGGLMLLGMALLRTGVLAAERSARFYRILLVVGAGLGLPAIQAGLVYLIRVDFVMEHAMLSGMLFNYWGSLGLALAYLALVMLLVRSGRLPGARRRLAACGRMAFSNYLGQTLIGTLIYYGHGLGLVGHTARWQDALVVLAVWAAQLWFSPWWLARFRFGPMEWLWRSLTYWRLQPLRRRAGTSDGPGAPPPGPQPA